MGTEMSAPGQTVSTPSANYMPFTADDLARTKVRDVGTNVSDLTDKLMTDDHWDRDRLLSPFIPLVDMDVRAADSSAVDLDEDIVDSNGRFRNIFEPQTWFGFAFDESFHCRT